jgi:type III secretion protein J
MPRLVDRRPPALAAVVAVAMALATASLAACSSEPLLHELSEREANQAMVALEEGGIPASAGRADGRDGSWSIAVERGDEARARRLLAARQLPRPRAPGLGEVFGQVGPVPTPVEEHARWLHALAGELARSLEAIDGVLEARVHLGLPASDPLHPGGRAAPRAAVLLKCRPMACPAVRAMEGGVRSLVAGAADGLSAEAVAVVIAEGVEPAPPPSTPARRRPLLGVAGAAGLAALALGLLAWRDRRRRAEP